MNSALRFESASDDETRAVGRQLAKILPPHAVVLLTGDLGAGKTTLTKGIAEGRRAAHADDVSSPTFTLIHQYGDPPSIYHIDLYRLDDAEQVRRLGLDELFDRDALILIEWGERFLPLMPSRYFQIRITDAGDDRRIITLDETRQ